MVIYYERLYKQKGIRRLAHYVKPRILDANTFYFPINSCLHWFKISDKEEYVTKEYAWFNNIERGVVETISEYSVKATYGKYISKPFVLNKFISENIKLCKEFKFPKPNVEIKKTNKVMSIINYGPLNIRYRYLTQPMLTYYRYKNVITTILENMLTIENDRNKFLILDIPDTILPRIQYDKYINRLTNAHMNKFPTPAHFTMLELWKLITPEFRKDSVFNIIPQDRSHEINLLLHINNKYILINLKTLLGSIKDYNIEINGIKARPFIQFKKLFYSMISQFIENPSMSDSEIEQQEKEIDKDPDKVINQVTEEKKEESNVTTNVVKGVTSDTSKSDSAVPNTLTDVINLLKTRNTVKVENKETIEANKDKESQAVDKYIDEQTEEDDEYEKIKDQIEDVSLKDQIDDFQDEELEENVINQVDEINNTSDTNVLDSMINRFDIELNENLKELNDINKETLDYYSVGNRIQVLKDNKLLNKKQMDTMLAILEKQNKDKSPYSKDVLLKDVLDDKKDNYVLNKNKVAIEDNKVVFDKSYNNNTINAMREDYLLNQYHKDIIRVIYSLQNSKYIIESYTINPIEDPLGSLEEHKISIRTLDNKTHNIKLMLPVISSDGRITMNGMDYIMRWQRQDLPLRKIESGRVKLSSYYAKYFITKDKYKANDAGYYIMNVLAKRYNLGEDIKDLVMLPVKNEEVKLPLDYSKFSRYIKSFRYKNYRFSFDYNKRINIFKDLTPEVLKNIENKNNLVLIGSNGSIPVLIDFNNELFELRDNKYISIGNLYNLLSINRDNEPIEFSSISIYKKQIPIIVLLSYYVGLLNMLKLLKVKYRFEEVNTRVKLEHNEYKVKFSDTQLVIQKDFGLGDMVLAGLLNIEKTLLTTNFKTLNNKQDCLVLFNKLGYTLIHVNNIKTLETLFVDPITLSILKERKLPTNFKGLLIEASKMLLDDYYKNPNNITDMSIKGYERIAGLMYNEITKSIKEYENKLQFSKAKILLNPYVIISLIQEDSTTVLIDDLNPMAEMKQTEDVSYLGALGFNKEALARDSRVYNSSEIGIISEAAKDNGDVGITAYMSASPKIDNIRGTTSEFNPKEDGMANIFSSTALLSPFGTSDDSKRLNFSSIMASHIIPINSMRVPYVRTGYETIIPVRAGDKFCISAEEDGSVTKVTTNSVEVKYKNKSKTYKIKNWTSKEESGSCYLHIMKSNVKEGDKVKKDDTLIYDQAFFEPDIFNPKRVIYKQGDIINVALSEEIVTNEDSSAMSINVASRLGTQVTKTKSIVLPMTDSVFEIPKQGSNIKTGDVLISFSSDIINSDQMDERTIQILKTLKNNVVKSKYTGVLTKLVVRYNCELDQMSNSIRELAIISDKQLKQDTGYTGRVYKDNYSIKGDTLLEGQVEIKFYITVDTTMGIGDKAIFGNQLKFTVGEVYNNEITAEDGTVIDAKFSYKSISARIVLSPLLMGTTGMILEKLTDKVVDMYFNK